MRTQGQQENMGDTSIRVSEELLDELFDRKDRGDTYEDVIWRLIEHSDRVSLDSDPKGESAEDTIPGPASSTDESYSVTDEAEDTLRELELSGSGSKYETRVEAVLKFYDYLREHEGERVAKGDLEEFAEEADVDPGYTSFTSLWSNWVKKNDRQGRPENTLTRLPGVEMDGDDYIYTAPSGGED